MGLIH